jgi:hypothetical protein
MLTMKSLNLAARLLLELSALAAFAYWGWHTGNAPVTQWLLAVITPLLAALLWGRFVAPQAPRRLDDPVRAGVEVVFFGGATAALAAAGAGTTAGLFGIVATASLLLMFVFGQRGM